MANNDDGLVPAPILIVDDAPANLLALEAVLEPLGYPIVTAASGAEALKLVAASDFSMVLMDVHMPGLDGYQTTALIRERERSKDVPVIFLTAVNRDREHAHRGYALGAVDYVSKPFDPDVLRAKVRTLVSMYSRGQRAERERSQQAERLRDLFLGAIGHDLRNPLDTILMGAHMIAAGVAPEEAHRGCAQRIERAAKRMARIIEDILDLTQGQLADGIPLTLEPSDLGDLCRHIVEDTRLAHPERALEFATHGDTSGTWDRVRLGRVTSNLVDNAIKHGGGAVQVSVIGEGDDVALVVHNRGAPIPADVLPTLFEPFRRGHTAASGLGLGLYIARETVRAHHGSIIASSTLAEGTTFKVMLPRARLMVAPAPHNGSGEAVRSAREIELSHETSATSGVTAPGEHNGRAART